MAAIPRPDRSGTLDRAAASARVERDAERRLEDAGPRARLVVAGDRGRARLADDRDERDGRSLRALAFDRETGRELVNVEVFRVDDPAAVSIPRTAAPRRRRSSKATASYVHFGADGTAALSTDGEVVWKMRFPYESQHGSGGSPVVYGDLLIFSCDGAQRGVRRRARQATGKVRWKTLPPSPCDQAYSTPLVIRVGERDRSSASARTGRRRTIR